MEYSCEVERKKLENRLSRIAGQVNSLKKKFADKDTNIDDDPYEIIRQLSAIKGAVNGMISSYVEHYAKGHLIDDIKKDSRIDAEAKVDNLLEIIKVYGK